MRQDLCLDGARKSYEEEWAEKCKLVAEVRAKGLQDCLSKYRSFLPNPKERCEQAWGEVDASENCSLAHEAVQFIDDRYKSAKDECFKRFPSHP